MYTLTKKIIPKALYFMNETPQPHFYKYQGILTTILCVNNGWVHYQEIQNAFFQKCDVIANKFREVSDPLPEFQSINKNYFSRKPCDSSGWWN